jgi:pteridine reductase
MPSPSKHKALAGRRALVTGAGRRVGAEIARTLGEQGMDVAVHFHGSRDGALRTCAAVEAHGTRAVALEADLKDRAAAQPLIARTLEALGGLDLLVLSAASFERTDLKQDATGLLDASLELNLIAPFNLARAAIAPLCASRGSIVAVTCVSRLLPYRGYLAYEVSKAALHQLVRVLALELAPEVRVNAVAPGTVLPPEGLTSSELESLRANVPLGRFGSPRDVADAVVCLASNELLTGTEIVVDGGRVLSG